MRYFCKVNIDQKYMLRAIQLGKNALGIAAPNPMVGAVLVYEDRVVGEGFTSAYGGPHAEVNAIQSVKDRSLLPKTTLYVTLEPCSHHGKTPPCSDLIIESKIPKVVIGLKDPHDKVDGRGLAKLKSAGVEVKMGVLEEACRTHHKRFLSFQEKKRPYIILKWAESQDGFIAPNPSKRNKNPEPYWISNSYSKQLVHRWRSEEQAILVGTQTVLHDNPKLNTRSWEGKHPIRVVLDRSLKIPSKFHVLDGSIKTIVLTEVTGNENKENLIFESIDFKKHLAANVCEVLYKNNITSLLVEGGAKTLMAFIAEGLWDEARIFKGRAIFASGIASPRITANLVSSTSILNDTLTVLQND
jgi:diaminohydroxyphosphoribosylaminopyrimidine deaminase/5-amino-6-(5-phosphoribosylamino)uracil reductase